MSHLTGHTHEAATGVRRAQPPPGRAPAILTALLSGALTAGLGLGVIAVVVLSLWITSPYPDSGPGNALRVAAGLWLLAHGGDLLRGDAAGGGAVPLGLTPLMLTAIPMWTLNRAGAHAVESGALPQNMSPGRPSPPRHRIWGGALPVIPLEASAGELNKPGSEWYGAAAEDGTTGSPRPLDAPTTVACLAVGYTLVAVAALGYSAAGPLRGTPLSALVLTPMFAVIAAGTGTWRASGRPAWRTPKALRRTAERLPPSLLTLLPFRGTTVVVRSATAGILVLVAGGAVLTTTSLVLRAPAVSASFTTLTDALSGRSALMLLSAVLVPNAAVWAACYALGPGFAVGAGTVVGPLHPAQYGALPNFPLLAALPAPDNEGPLTWAALVVPLVAAVVTAIVAARGVGEGIAGAWNITQTTAVATGSALAAGAGMALLAAAASGPVGGRGLAEFGPYWGTAGFATLCWTLVVCLPVLLLVRWRRHRGWHRGRRHSSVRHRGRGPRRGPWWRRVLVPVAFPLPGARLRGRRAKAGPDTPPTRRIPKTPLGHRVEL